jgi:hypothetical protein
MCSPRPSAALKRNVTGAFFTQQRRSPKGRMINNRGTRAHWSEVLPAPLQRNGGARREHSAVAQLNAVSGRAI